MPSTPLPFPCSFPTEKFPLVRLLLLLVPAETFLIVMDFTEKHFFIHAAPPVVLMPLDVVVFVVVFPLLHVLQFKRIGLRMELLLWPGESPASVYVCVHCTVCGSCASKSYFRYK